MNMSHPIKSDRDLVVWRKRTWLAVILSPLTPRLSPLSIRRSLTSGS